MAEKRPHLYGKHAIHGRAATAQPPDVSRYDEVIESPELGVKAVRFDVYRAAVSPAVEDPYWVEAPMRARRAIERNLQTSTTQNYPFMLRFEAVVANIRAPFATMEPIKIADNGEMQRALRAFWERLRTHVDAVVGGDAMDTRDVTVHLYVIHYMYAFRKVVEIKMRKK